MRAQVLAGLLRSAPSAAASAGEAGPGRSGGRLAAG